jgi:hypothetical protein
MRPYILCTILFSAIICLPTARAIDPDLARFAAAKQAQIREYEKILTNKVPAVVWSYFDAVRVDDWETATNLAARIDKMSGRYGGAAANASPDPALATIVWSPICEMIGTYDAFHNWDNKWLHRFGSEIMHPIPRGSIYFGGTDPGRFVISALSESQQEGKPFFTITQNQLADNTYLEYLGRLYGSKIYIPSTNDSSKAFQEYLADAQQRMKDGKLKPGEDVRVVDGRVKVSGQVAVMEINGLLAKIILERNSDVEFFVEESFALDWMYPQLAPEGPIFKLHHKAMPLKLELVQKNQAYWKKIVGELVGDWIKPETSVKEVCDFADTVLLRKELKDFKGDPGFVRSDEVQKTFSKLRASIAQLYVWHAEHTRDMAEKKEFQEAADLAFRQACALCPYSPEAVFRYANLLTQLNRRDDALLIAKTGLRFDPKDATFPELVRALSSSR